MLKLLKQKAITTSISGLATTAALTAVKSEIPDVSNLGNISNKSCIKSRTK